MLAAKYNLMKRRPITIATLTIIFSFYLDTAFSCSCMTSGSTDSSFKKSAIVVQGVVISADTVFRVNSFITSTRRKGVRVGRQYVIADTQRLVRIKFLVQNEFKFNSQFPDTIYVLTEDPRQDACGFPFTPYFPKGTVSDQFYEYIIYADRWTDKKLINVGNKGKRRFGDIQSNLSNDTFFTSTCMRTQPTNKAELDRLHKLIRSSEFAIPNPYRRICNPQ